MNRRTAGRRTAESDAVPPNFFSAGRSKLWMGQDGLTGMEGPRKKEAAA